MVDIIETPLRLFAELTPTGALAGRFQLEFQRRVEEAGKEIVPPAVMARDLTPEEGAAMFADVSALRGTVDALGEQIAAERAEAAAAHKDALDKQQAQFTAERDKAAAEAATAAAAASEQIATLSKDLNAKKQELMAAQMVISRVREANATWDGAVLPLLSPTQEAV